MHFDPFLCFFSITMWCCIFIEHSNWASYKLFNNWQNEMHKSFEELWWRHLAKMYFGGGAVFRIMRQKFKRNNKTQGILCRENESFILVGDGLFLYLTKSFYKSELIFHTVYNSDGKNSKIWKSKQQWPNISSSAVLTCFPICCPFNWLKGSPTRGFFCSVLTPLCPEHEQLVQRNVTCHSKLFCDCHCFTFLSIFSWRFRSNFHEFTSLIFLSSSIRLLRFKILISGGSHSY